MPEENRIETDPRDALIVQLRAEVTRLEDMGRRAELHAAECQRLAAESRDEVRRLRELLGRRASGR